MTINFDASEIEAIVRKVVDESLTITMRREEEAIINETDGPDDMWQVGANGSSKVLDEWLRDEWMETMRSPSAIVLNNFDLVELQVAICNSYAATTMLPLSAADKPSQIIGYLNKYAPNSRVVEFRPSSQVERGTIDFVFDEGG